MMYDVDDRGEIEIEPERRWQLEFRRQVDSNDPSLVQVTIGDDTREDLGYSPHDGDWGELGASIGRNTFIEEINIDIDQEDFGNFARGFASNRSIKSLTLNCAALVNGGMLGALFPFFINNSSLKSLHIRYADSTCLHVLASVLRQFDTLTEFTVCDYEDQDDEDEDEDFNERDEFIKECEDFSVAVSGIFDALAGHSSLTKLSMEQFGAEGWQYRIIEMSGWESLAALLRKSSSKLMVLELENTPIDIGGASILAAGLLVNASLKEFALKSTQQMTKTGWDTIFAALKRSTCTLEKLSICMNWRMYDDVSLSLLNALLDNCTLKSLRLCSSGSGIGYQRDATDASKGALVQLLQNPLCALERLDLDSVGLNNDSIMCVGNAIANNSRLRELFLSGNHNVTTDGWVNFLTFPQGFKLEKLIIGYNFTINDEALDVFRIFLMNNRRLKDLLLGHFPNVTTAGWTAFSTILRNPNSSLEKLDLTWGDSSYDDVVTSFADALTNNKRLRELSIGCSTDIFAPFTCIVCNSSSIMNTYNSNHILSELSQDYLYSRRPLPIDLASALQINRENSVCQAARLKIIKTHFSGSNINTTPFTVMELKVLPTAISWMAAISWMGQECDMHDISNLLFAFFRSMPSLCDTKSRCKKRKSGT